MATRITKEHAQEFPDYDGEVYHADDLNPQGAVEPPDDTKDIEIKEIAPPRSASPISTANKATPVAQQKDSPVIHSKVGRKPTGRAMTNTERQAKWRAANRDVALARQREAMKKIRKSS